MKLLPIPAGKTVRAATGLSLTVGQTVAPLRSGRLVSLPLLANFVLMPLSAFAIARVLHLDQPLGEGPLLLGAAAGAPFMPNLAGISKSNVAFSVGLMVPLIVVTIAFMPIVLPRLLEGVTSFETALTWPETQQRIQTLLEFGLQRESDFEIRWPEVLGTLLGT